MGSERRILDVFDELAELNDEMHIAELIDRTADTCDVERHEVLSALSRRAEEIDRAG